MIHNLKELVEAYDKGDTKRIIGFGKHRGKTLSKIPSDYVDWARKEILKPSSPMSPSKTVEKITFYGGSGGKGHGKGFANVEEARRTFLANLQKFFLIEPKEIHNLYIKAMSKATKVDMEPFYDDLGKEEQRIWEEFSSDLKEYFMKKIEVNNK